MQLIFNRYSENTFSAVTKHRHRPPPAKRREEKKSRHVVYVHVKSCSEKGDRWIVRSALSAQKVHTQSKEKIGQWRWREIVTSMDVVAWGSGGARASGLRLTQLHGLWWRIYGLGSRERCLPENQASPTPFSPPPFFFFFFIFSSFSFSPPPPPPPLIWSRQTRDGYFDRRLHPRRIGS